MAAKVDRFFPLLSQFHRKLQILEMLYCCDLLGFWIGFFQQVSERFRERQRGGWKACRKSRIPFKDSKIGGTRAHNSQHPRQLLIPDTKIWPESSTGAHFPGCRISFPYSKICWRFGRGTGYGARNDGQVNLQFQMKLKYNKNVTQVFDLKTGYCLHFTASPRCIDVAGICRNAWIFLNCLGICRKWYLFQC